MGRVVYTVPERPFPDAPGPALLSPPGAEGWLVFAPGPKLPPGPTDVFPPGPDEGLEDGTVGTFVPGEVGEVPPGPR